MKKTLIAMAAALFMVSCSQEPGTLHKIDASMNPNIEVYRYYYTSMDYIYITRFKDQPNVVTANWTEMQGKVATTVANTIIFENDSVQVILKK